MAMAYIPHRPVILLSHVADGAPAAMPYGGYPFWLFYPGRAAYTLLRKKRTGMLDPHFL